MVVQRRRCLQETINLEIADEEKKDENKDSKTKSTRKDSFSTIALNKYNFGMFVQPISTLNATYSDSIALQMIQANMSFHAMNYVLSHMFDYVMQTVSHCFDAI